MKMIAAARLKKAQGALIASRPYAYKVEELIRELTERLAAENRPLPSLMRPRSEAKDKILVVFTSDRGLCGSYNVSLLRSALDFVQKTKAAGGQVIFFVVGKKGRDFLVRSNFTIEKEYLNFTRKPSYSQAEILAKEAVEYYRAHSNVGELAVLFTDFRSMLRQTPVIASVLPAAGTFDSSVIESKAASAGKPKEAKEKVLFDFIYEPKREQILEALIPRYINTQISRMMHEAYTSEQASRMNVMENATRNAGDLIDELTLLANKVRQASITREILEVVSGAEALTA